MWPAAEIEPFALRIDSDLVPLGDGVEGAVEGLGARAPVTVDDVTMIGTSFPGFVPLLTRLGANFASC